MVTHCTSLNFDPKVEREKESEQDLEQKAKGLLWVCSGHGTGGKADHQRRTRKRTESVARGKQSCRLRVGGGQLHPRAQGKGLQDSTGQGARGKGKKLQKQGKSMKCESYKNRNVS